MGGIVNGSRNLGLTFDNAKVTGVITASDARHYYNGKYYPRMGVSDMAAFNRVKNTPGAAVNNGVIVTLTNGSKWTVTGTSYLTKLVIEGGSSVTPSSGKTMTLTVNNGSPVTDIPAGTYSGNIVITVR
jgi:hypothetical protein